MKIILILEKNLHMLSFFRRLFPFLFKDEETENKDRGLIIKNDDVNTSATNTHTNRSTSNVKRLDVEGKKLLTLRRNESEAHFTKGELIFEGQTLAMTLEGPLTNQNIHEKMAIPAGDYLIGVRSEGGYHTTYSFRYGSMHQGMIHIKDVPYLNYVYFLIGNEASLSYGNILLGDAFHGEHLIGSEAAYHRSYQQITELIAEGEELVLRVE
ncbi:MAG: DUF5675 family protein [Bacteroidia bacterium]|nr:DUF5675 family protein [Bacteroidia bacterium]